ncbi:hypothetical protein ACFW2Y_29135 [Streptomyces sp. NPDC058877]
MPTKRKGNTSWENFKNLVTDIVEDDRFGFEADSDPRQDVGH